MASSNNDVRENGTLFGFSLCPSCLSPRHNSDILYWYNRTGIFHIEQCSFVLFSCALCLLPPSFVQSISSCVVFVLVPFGIQSM